jgi:hypothetical protein
LPYELFPINKLVNETFHSVIGKGRRNYDTGHIIVIADMGIVTGDNIHYLVREKPEMPRNRYVFSFSMRGGTKAFNGSMCFSKCHIRNRTITFATAKAM